MVRISLLLAVLAVGALTALGQQPCKRHVEASGKFSICPPAEWQIASVQGQAYSVFVGPENSNINIQRAPGVAAPLATYVDGSISYLLTHVREQGADEIKQVSRIPFATSEGSKGFKVVLDIRAASARLISIQYFFDHPSGGKLTVTGTTDPVNRTADEKLFDAAVRSLRFP